MALIGHAGVETSDLSEFAGSVGTVSASVLQANSGNYSVRVNPSGVQQSQVYLTTTDPKRLTAYFYIQTTPDRDSRIIGSGLANTAGVVLTTDRYLDLYLGGAKQVDGATALNTGQWYRVSLSVDGDNAKVYLDGTEHHSDANAGYDAIDNGYVGLQGVGGTLTGEIFVDDIAIDETASTADLGDIRVQVALPVADGNQNDFDVTSGFGLCDNLPDDTDYVENNQD
ncbi:MAG: LamG-like jellyroll fold domain-containing protein, partial [Planctomycetota bacterium]